MRRDRIFIIGSCAFTVLVAAVPILDAITNPVSPEIQIDASLMNGLLTVSSILFGFSSLVVTGHRPIEKEAWLPLFVPLFLIGLSGNMLIQLCLDRATPLEALLSIEISLWANVATFAATFGYFSAVFEEEQE